MGVKALVAVLVLACLAAASSPAFAQDPPEQDGKQDLVISPVLLQFIQNRAGGSGQGAPQPDDKAAVRGLPEGGVATPKGSYADSASTSSESPDGPVRFDSSGDVQLYIHVKETGDDTLKLLRSLGATIEITNSDWNIVQAWLPPASLGRVAELDVVKEITPPDYGIAEAGRVTTEGDGIHRADLARHLGSVSGKGVKVGVISTGVYSRRTSQGSGDLPSSIEIDPNNRRTGDEGTAMLEIIHDLAPGAQLASSAPYTSLDMANGVLWLANKAFDGEGVDIIVDDLGYYFEPQYEPGVIAQAATDAVDGGVVYVTAAGNQARRHYDGQFSDSGDGYHDFDSDSSVTDTALRVRVRSSIVLQWNDRFGSSGNDYDLFLCPPGLKPVKFNLQNGICARSDRKQDGDDAPREIIYSSQFNFSTGDLYIRKYSGSAKRLKLYVLQGEVLEHGVSEGSIVGHSAVTGALAVGAINASDPGNDDPASYSSRGPSRIYDSGGNVEERPKPDVMGIDGVRITGAGGFFNPFFGTSAAAPHVAGIAALVMEAQRKADSSMKKKAVADAVAQKIKDTAVDLGDTGHDSTFGHGRVDALAAIESLAESSTSFNLHSSTAHEDTYTVDSTGDGADSDTTDGVCDDGSVVGSTNCTLRAAIEQANAGSSATIKFNIPGSGVKTISPASALPLVTVPVFIDGFSQPGASAGTVLIELDGSNAGSSADGLELKADRNRVRGLAVNNFSQYGIEIRKRTGTLQLGSSRHVLTGNMIGTDTTGSTDKGNGWSGVHLNITGDVLLQDNVISGNGGYGVLTTIGGRIHLYDNKIGTNADGTADLGNSGAGVRISSRSVEVKDNVISGNDSYGIHLASVASDALIENNYIGTNEGGTAALANTGSGIYIFGPDHNLVFGNTIGGNGSHGVRIHGTYTEDNVIAENYIGTNASGTDLGNSGSGVYVSGGTDDNTVEGNTIAHNTGDGVTVVDSGTTGNTIWENSIHSNDGHGIDLEDDGVTANDTGDGDSGPNHLQNNPYDITFATNDDDASVGFKLAVIGERRYIVDFYSCDSSTSGEGEEWLGYSAGSIDTTGIATLAASSALGQITDFTAPDSTVTHITATATDTETGSTSEFAPCVAIVDLPELVISESDLEVTEGSTATYTVRLSSLPSAEVTVSLTEGNKDAATVSDDTLTFTTTNGTTNRTITVTGVDDNDANHACCLTEECYRILTAVSHSQPAPLRALNVPPRRFHWLQGKPIYWP